MNGILQSHLVGRTKSILPAEARRGSLGFSLVEILVVLSVIGLITAVTAPMLFATMKANRLSSAGEDLVNKISLAQQLAVSRNHDIELRFYHYVDPEDSTSKDHYRAMLVAEPVADPAAPGGTKTQFLSELSRIRGGIVIANDSNLSPIFSEAGVTDTNDTDNVIPGANANYRSVRFFPDGSNDLTLETNRAYLTVVDERDFERAGDIPKNFFAVQIDHYTSRATSYRP